MDEWEFEALSQQEQAGAHLSVVQQFRLNKERQRRAGLATHPLREVGRFVAAPGQAAGPVAATLTEEGQT